ncbi:hypothetical protein Pyrfu_1357 [Pyrolobus fumarii 1A]|uniref:Uncharacterized protein n=1 Tax=Pyrolobus fumarii (strain DSM 11204 / 1A) TaxID=694429 RepID=G0EGR7_PYRF1|nr:hypothetical protein Pyrfu_1357 [Pyrolobus fumarii 1A]
MKHYQHVEKRVKLVYNRFIVILTSKAMVKTSAG